MNKRAYAVLGVLLAVAVIACGEDCRRQPLKDLHGYFPFTPPRTLEEWKERREYVRRRILVSTGLWPMPTKPNTQPVVHGRIEMGEYTIDKVYFESVPGLFVTGSLYRPKKFQGRIPAVLISHGHWRDARIASKSPDEARKAIAQGLERFEKGARSVYQSLGAQLARMGCVAFQWDMLSDSDSIQFSRDVVHRFKKQRPEMNTLENWGFYSPQAEAHLQSILGLHNLHSMRSLDFVLSLPEVDPARVAMTGASGGGTQTMLLAAIDDRLQLSFPVVMVSTAMQGGCTCENSSLLRIDTGNIEFAALFAPKPQGMNTANDWTRELSTKGFPELQALYKLYGAPGSIMLQRGEHYPHGYNAITRSAFYTFINTHFKLGFKPPVIEQELDRVIPREELSVWDDAHPAPKADDPEFERSLLRWLASDARTQIEASAATLEGLRQVVAPAVEVLLGRTLAKAGQVEWKPAKTHDQGDHTETSGLFVNTTYQEEVEAIALVPKAWKGRSVVWLGDNGRKALHGKGGGLLPEVVTLLGSGAAVYGADLLFQDDPASNVNRIVNNPREFAGYTYGYNPPLFAQRVHDALSIIACLKESNAAQPGPSISIAMAGWGGAGPIAVAARAVAGGAIARTVADTNNFRFGKLLDYLDPGFLVGGAKYLDLPGFMALGAPHPLWLNGETRESVSAAADAYRLHNAVDALVVNQGADAQSREAAIAWLAK